MGNNFSNVKRRTRKASIITSIAFGASGGALLIAVFVFIYKFFGKPTPYWIYIIGILSAAAVAALVYALLMPSDKRLAKRLDEEHGLKEKIRTMVEFKDSDDEFAVFQREDADEKLGKVDVNPWRKKQLISLLIVFCISAASFVTAFAIPGGAGFDSEKPLSEFDKEWILAELSDIINDVDKSLISDTLKESSLDELNILVDFVKEHDYLSEMKIRAIRSVISINKMLDAENSAPMIGEALKACSNSNLQELGEELVKLNGTAVKNKLTQLEDSVSGASSEVISFTADELSAAIAASGADSSSPFTVLLLNLVSALRGYSSGSGSVPDAFENVAFTAMDETMIQSMNKRMIQTVNSRLCGLFGIAADDLVEAGADEDIEITPPGEAPPSSDEPEDDKENEEIGSGGIGTGDRIYGSNDVIYNPYTDEYVPYGEVFDEYNNKLIQMIRDGRIPPDFEEFTEEYFRSLSDYNPEEAN